MLKGWKTIIFSTIMGVVMIVKGIATPEDAASAPSGEQVQGALDTFELLYGIVVMIGGWLFRAFTNSPIFKKEPEPPKPE
jgi:hypothetical protein